MYNRELYDKWIQGKDTYRKRFKILTYRKPINKEVAEIISKKSLENPTFLSFCKRIRKRYPRKYAIIVREYFAWKARKTSRNRKVEKEQVKYLKWEAIYNEEDQIKSTNSY